MANNHSTLTGLFTDIADAIREKTGGTENIVADAFPEAIAGIETCPEDALFLKSEDTTALMPSSVPWYSVTYGDGKFVAVGSTGIEWAIAYSTDGITWSATTMLSDTTWHSVTYGDGKFVVVGSETDVAYSTDGITWTATTMPSDNFWCSVTYGDGKFVAVAAGTNVAAYSTDGINWTATTMPSSGEWNDVTYGNGKFVAVDSGTNAAYSTDGITWTATTIPSATRWCSVTYGDGKFVAVASVTNVAAYSTDGITWSASTMPISGEWFSVTYGDGKFVAGSHGTAVAYSTDGITWTATTMPSNDFWYSVTYGDGKFVAVALTSKKVAISYDGINWITTVTKTTIVNTSDEDVTEETVQATGILDPELTTQDDLIAQLTSALEGKAGATAEDLSAEMTAQDKAIASQDDLIAQIATALEGKTGASGGASVETSTVTIYDNYNLCFDFVSATILEGDVIDACYYSESNGNLAFDENNYLILNNVVKNSIITILMNDTYNAGTTTTGATLLMEYDFDGGGIHDFKTIFVFKVTDVSARIVLSYDGVA